MTNEVGLTFSQALVALKCGEKVTNSDWNGKGMYLEMQVPTKLSKMERPYLYINPGEGWKVPWTPLNVDLFSDCWEIIREE